MQVGRIKCPLLLVNAADDQTVPAVESAEDVSYISYIFSAVKKIIVLYVVKLG